MHVGRHEVIHGVGLIPSTMNAVTQTRCASQDAWAGS